MAEIVGTNGPDNESNIPATEEADLISGLDGNDDLRGLGGNDTISGDGGTDDVYGGEGDDSLAGGIDNDQLFGGDGNDTLFGESGDDLIFGEKGFNDYNGGDGNDTLSGLGELSTNIFGDTIEDVAPEGTDTFTGGDGADRFKLLKASDDEGRLFVKGQKFAVITDFTPDDGNGDKIVLPGAAENYRGVLTGENNESTAIIYKEDPDIDISLGFGGVSIGTGLAIDVPNESALVAILENVTARNMEDPNFYEYVGVS